MTKEEYSLLSDTGKDFYCKSVLHKITKQATVELASRIGEPQVEGICSIVSPMHFLDDETVERVEKIISETDGPVFLDLSAAEDPHT